MLSLKINNLPIDVEFMQFSGGERHVKINISQVPKGGFGFIEVDAFLQQPHEIFDLLLLNDAVNRLQGFGYDTQRYLNLPYVPYARQDRVMKVGEPLSIFTFSALINAMNFDKVRIQDPHSPVTEALINKVAVTHQHELVYARLAWKIKKENLLLVSPDAGAVKKTQHLADSMALEAPVVGFKKRDVSTGAISGTGIVGDVSGRDVLILDDICDYGGTFKALGKELKSHGANRVLLWVTHGIFAGGIDTFEGTVDEIYSQNVWENNLTDRNTSGIFKPFAKL